MTRRWLITGATGLLGDYLADACRLRGPVVATSRSGGDLPCDLRDLSMTERLVAEAAPDVVIHAAALTDVDRCEREPREALAANQSTATNLAAALAPTTQLVVISTDQVYPDTPGPHAEPDASPVNSYGRSKLAGEQAALMHPKAVAVRTNFFGPSRRPQRESLSDFFVRALKAKEPVALFADVFFSPLHMATLAGIIAELVELDATGVINVGCREGRSKADFALAIARHKHLPTETARLANSSTLPGRAPRAHDLRLDVSKLESILGRSMPTLEEEIAKL